jgi:hypothetical protein
VPANAITLDEAVDLTRTGDVWVFRGRTRADRAIQVTTNSPVNHVGMAVTIEDLPPLMWHAELGRSLPDLWAGTRQRGVQLHDLRDAVVTWARRYGQRAWLRQLEPPATRAMEDAALRVIARLDGMPFPSTAQLAGRWLRGRMPTREQLRRQLPTRGRLMRRMPTRDRTPRVEPSSERAGLESAYCAEVVALTFEEMGLLAGQRRPSWYDPGRFWSGDQLRLAPGFRLGDEIAITT